MKNTYVLYSIRNVSKASGSSFCFLLALPVSLSLFLSLSTWKLAGRFSTLAYILASPLHWLKCLLLNNAFVQIKLIIQLASSESTNSHSHKSTRRSHTHTRPYNRTQANTRTHTHTIYSRISSVNGMKTWGQITTECFVCLNTFLNAH